MCKGMGQQGCFNFTGWESLSETVAKAVCLDVLGLYFIHTHTRALSAHKYSSKSMSMSMREVDANLRPFTGPCINIYIHFYMKKHIQKYWL